MRRKSERNKSSPNAKQPEKITRRTTRRNKKSPEKSINEEQSENSSEHEESAISENDTGEVVIKRTRRASTRRASEESKEKVIRPKRKTTLKQAEITEEDCITADTLNYETALKTEVEPSSTSNVKTAEDSLKSDDESTASNVNSTQPNNENEQEEQEPSQTNSKKSEDNNEVPEANDVNEKERENVEPTTQSEEGPKGEEDLKDSNREVIPEETDQAVEIDSTTKSVSSKHDKSVLNDLSAADAASNNKTKQISENNADTTTDGGRDGPATTTEDREKENADSRPDEGLNGTSENKTRKKVNLKDQSDKTISKPLIVRKRKWLSNKNASSNKSDIITISTDSLKGLISDVKPVPLSDVRLESSSEPDQDSDDVKVVTSTSYDYNRRSDEDNATSPPPSSHVDEQASSHLAASRKVSIVPEMNDTRPPSPPKHNPSNILYITNLVRPFTVLQLKGLLVRTGKIVENGFWMDKIKSKCFVKYETEDEAIETRHALHGIRWPPSNPKCLNVDFGTDNLMEKAIVSTMDIKPIISSRHDFYGSANDGIDYDKDKKIKVEKPVREWDVGKRPDIFRTREIENDDREREIGRPRDRERDRDNERERDRNDRNDRNDRRRRSPEKRRKSASLSPARKFIKKEEPPIRLLDDLFRKTKTTPCIYWLPLTPEQIAIREQERLKQMAEHKKRIEAIKKERIEREQAKEGGRASADRDKEKDREHDRDRRRRGNSRSRRGNSRSSRDRDRSGRRRY